MSLCQRFSSHLRAIPYNTSSAVYRIVSNHLEFLPTFESNARKSNEKQKRKKLISNINIFTTLTNFEHFNFTITITNRIYYHLTDKIESVRKMTFFLTRTTTDNNVKIEKNNANKITAPIQRAEQKKNDWTKEIWFISFFLTCSLCFFFIRWSVWILKLCRCHI